MKHIIYIGILEFFVMIGCTPKQEFYQIDTGNDHSFLTKASIDNKCEGYALTEVDINNYFLFKQLEGKSKEREVVLSEIIPIYWENIACLYVIQYEDGFDVISADKRSPIPIAEVARGTFQDCNDPNGFGGHLNLMAEEVWFSLNGYLKDPSPEAEENIQSSLDFWRMINADSLFIAENADSIDSNLGFRFDPNIPPGNWVLVGVTTTEEVYDSIPHLTTTTWYQDSIYNYYCPYDMNSNGVIVKCPAGCVAIAGAQMLYYLHSKDGVPLTSPANGSCTGEVFNHNVVQNFWNYSSGTWSLMLPPRDGTDIYAALLIGDVGKRVSMQYAWFGSGALVEDLKDYVFQPYGWNSIFSNSYLSNKIVSNLQNGYPIVCGGARDIRGVGRLGHAFLIDRYKRCRVKTTSYYEWEYLESNYTGPLPYVSPITTISYDSPHISYYGMNWGQEDSIPNASWCSLSGIWQYGDLPPYQYDRQMIYDFSIIQ
jgi:hypothetical protein